ncbi:ATP-binding protein [Flavobacterium sp. NG2]|nr:ATP-binding protein [Flavobacterium sp. NG2]WPR71919.1 ATP-binding protein [Flavobacterium sp. NG2]
MDGLSASDVVINALKQNDRKTLQKISSPYFKKLKKDLDSDLLTFISTEGEVLLRANLIDKFGDYWNERVLFQKSSATGLSYFYIESGTYSDVNLRVILPVRDKTNSIVGYITVGKNFNKILQQTANQTHMDYLFLVKKKKLNPKRRKDSIQKNGLFQKGNDSLVIGWSTFPEKIKYPKEIIEEKLTSDSISNLKLNDNNYLSKSFTLMNFDKTEFGYVFILHDSSLHFDDLKRIIIFITLISFLMIFVLCILFNKILDRVEKNIYEQNLKLKLELKKRIEVDKKLIINNNELKQLTLIASHDLRSPLTCLEGLLELLKEEGIDSEISIEIINNAGSSIQLMKETIDSLTTIVRQKESFVENVDSRQDIQQIFDQVILQMKYLIDEKQIEVKSDFSSCPSLVIKDIHLKSILQNILSNSIKYATEDTEKKRIIEVSTKKSNENCLIIIKDNGIGFDSEFQKDNLFKPFKRFHHEKTGSGIGLYLTKLIVENYNGTIQIYSKTGVGTTVTIKI